jgi:hypothetical protein
MESPDNFAHYAENFHPGMIQTMNFESQSLSNTEPASGIDFGILGDDPAAWVWDGVSR